MTDKTKPVEFTPPQSMEDLWAISKPLIDKAEQSIVMSKSEKINKSNIDIGRGFTRCPPIFGDCDIETITANIRGSISLQIINTLRLGTLTAQLVDERFYYCNLEGDTVKIKDVHTDGRISTKYILDNDVVRVESENNVSTIMFIDITIKDIVLNKERYDKVNMDYALLRSECTGKNEIAYRLKYRTSREIDDHTEICSYESISEDELIVNYKLTIIDYRYKDLLNCVPIFDTTFGYMTMLCRDSRYALLYSSSKDMYIAGCRRFSKEQAIAHWSEVVSDITNTNYLEDGYDEYDIVNADIRCKRAKMFLEAIDKNESTKKDA